MGDNDGSDSDEGGPGLTAAEISDGMRLLEQIYSQDERLYMGSKMAPEWGFLFDWFEECSYRFAMADSEEHKRKRYDTDDVRIGRRPDDWWINVWFDRGQLTEFDTLNARNKRYRTLREALILMSILAEVNYDTWQGELQRTNLFEYPEFVDPMSGPLQRKFCFTFWKHAKVAEYDWSKLKDLFSDQKYSRKFKKHLERARQVAASQGVDVSKMEPIPIRLRFYPGSATLAKQIQAIKSITQTVKELHLLEDAYRNAQRNTSSGETTPVFKLDSIDLDLHGFEFHPAVLAEIQALVETGVAIYSITLPCHVAGERLDEQAVPVAWSTLAMTLCGHTAKETPRPVQVRRLVLGHQASCSHILVQFCSALTNARGLKMLRVDSSRYSSADPGHLFWAWLGFALFSSCSTSSLEVLELDGFRLPPEAVSKMTNVARAKNPLRCLWETMSPSEPADRHPPSRRTITIAKGAKMAMQGLGSSPDPIQTSISWTGTVVHDEPANSALVVLLPGWGFCEVNRKSQSNKRARSESRDEPTHVVNRAIGSNRLKTLLIGVSSTVGGESRERSEAVCHPLVSFIQLVGGSLHGMALSHPAMNEATLAGCLEACPRLESLRVTGARLSSMDPFIRFYERGGQLSSLDLAKIQVPIDKFEAFLKLLVTTGYIKRTLKKLRIGKDWLTPFRGSTADIMTRVLTDKSTLDHLHIVRTPASDAEPVLWKEWRFHHNALALQPPPWEIRQAFLGGMLRLRSRNQAVPPTSTIALIFAFAGHKAQRISIAEHDTEEHDLLDW